MQFADSDFWSGLDDAIRQLGGTPVEPVVLSPAEMLYYHFAAPLVSAGWSAIPQTILNGRRPGFDQGRTIPVSVFVDRLPTMVEAKRWALENTNCNAAILLGTASGKTFCFDIDIDDRDMAFAVRRIIFDILGETPFERVGRWPRTALFYRAAGKMPRGRSAHFIGADGEASRHAIEILSTGKTITALGRHHLTGELFKWTGLNPMDHGPQMAPEVTEDQLAEVMDAINAAFPMWTNRAFKSKTPAVYEHVEIAGVVFPKLTNVFSAWAEMRGRVTDGRESFLWSMCRETVRRNPKLAAAETGVELMCRVIAAEFIDRISHEGGRWTARYVRAATESKVARAVEQLLAGHIAPWTPGTGIVPMQPVFDDNAFPWMDGRRASIRMTFSKGSEIERDARKLVTNRAMAEIKVAAGIDKVHEAFLDDVYSGENVIHLLKAPTGAGKTVKTLHRLADDPRTHDWDGRQHEDAYPGPFLYLLPTFKNIEELRSKADVVNLDPTLSDTALLAAAKAKGLVLDDDLEVALAMLRRDARDAGLEAKVYAGKKTAGCLKGDKMELLMKAGIPTSGLCKTTYGDGALREERLCEHYHSCPAIAQRKAAKEAHVVFLPRNFLDLKIPEEIGKTRGVIADESVFSLLVHHAIFPVSAFHVVRPEIRLADDEIGNGMKPGYVADFRAAAVRVVLKAFGEGVDPAKALRDYVLTGPNRHIPGLDLVRYAKRLCGQAIRSDARIHPTLTIAQITDLVLRKPSEHVGGEYRFWATIEDRILALLDDDNPELPLPRIPASRTATDPLVQYLDGDTDNASVRVSWLTKPNWQNAPMLLLDASGNPDILRAVFPNRKIVVHHVPVDLNLNLMVVPDRRFSTCTICPGPDATIEDRFNAAKTVHEMRTVISMVAGIYAHGHVVIGLPKKVRKIVEKGWDHPANVEFMHSMAFAGLDFARQHVFAISFGRMEIPVREMDAQVAALTAASIHPEMPIDVLGTGVDDLGDAIYPHVVPRKLMMRDGRDATYDTHEHASAMARAVQAQYREEQARQFIGRVRPVYRGDTPGAMIVGQAVPDDMIVDTMCSWEDLVSRQADYWDAGRRAGGLLNPQMLAAAAPETATEEQFADWLDSLPDDVMARYSVVDTIVGSVLVPGHHADPLGEVAAWCVRWGIDLGEMTVTSMCMHRAPAAPEGRPNDDIENVLGDRASRRIAEDTALDAVFARLDQTTYVAGKRNYRAGSGELELFGAPMGTWAVLDTMDDPWIYSDEPVVVAKPTRPLVPTFRRQAPRP